MHLLDSFQEGLLAIIFDSLDRVQHMFRRSRPDVVERWYIQLDGLVGRVEKRLAELGKSKVRLLVVSDHGFSDFEHKIHLNRWLVEQGFLKASVNGDAGSLNEVDWSASQAYAVGLNSLYLNLCGREGQGSVPIDQATGLASRIRERLLDWRGPDGRAVAQRVLLREEAFSGGLATYGPDLLVGYAPGYRVSSETGLGKWKGIAIEPNGDHWGADHCIDSQAVPGVIFCNQGLGGLTQPSFRDFPQLAIGKPLIHGQSAPPPPSVGGEGKEAIEERLKSLGYL
jgi:predicted AlkP superfamily phosphohydrolase/phosphomutase